MITRVDDGILCKQHSGLPSWWPQPGRSCSSSLPERHVSTPYYTKYAVVYDTYVITYLRQKHRIHTILPHTVIRFEIV